MRPSLVTVGLERRPTILARVKYFSQAREVARKMQVDKEWLYVPKNDPLNFRCPSCRTNIDKEAVVCPHCKLILQPDRHKEMQFATAL